MESGARWSVIAVAAMLELVSACPVLAQPPRSVDDRATLDLSAGAFGIFDHASEPFRFSVEYRWRPFGRWALAPGLGVTVAEGGANFAYGDLHKDFWLGRQWLLTASFGAGLFHDGGGVHLGNELEFQSGLEISRMFRDRFRIGVAFYHLSNGGLGHKNPGTEVAVLLVGIPIGAGPRDHGA
jgi:lipid A 3-O-deacylase